MKRKSDGNINGTREELIMELHTLKENELLTGISILAVLRHAKQLELSKCILIEPLLSYSQVLNALKRSNTRIKSIEDLIIKQSIAFANFNNRFHDKLLLSINAIILFEKLGLLYRKENLVYFSAPDFNFATKSLGEIAHSRISASGKLAEILQKGEASDFYLSLRIEI